jgi:transcriptional regulator of heat shock response
MREICLTKGLGVDNEQLKDFKEKVEYVLSIFEKHSLLAVLMGQEKGNWSHYMSGRNTITPEFIALFENIFRNVLKKQTFPENRGGVYSTEEAPETYGNLETKLADLAENTKEIADGQRRLEEKIDALLQK